MLLKFIAVYSYMVSFITVRHKHIPLARKVKVCDTFFSRTLGLMFRSPLDSGEGILLVAGRESVAQTSIHSFFVFFPFDVFWVNEEKMVVDKKRVYPFRAFLSSKAPAKYVLELAVGQLEKVELGEKLSF